MLERLHITNYALINDLEIEFHEGLNIITGETGAGKSIMLDALSLLFGARADSRSVKRGDKKSVIECEFSLDKEGDMKEFFEANDLEWDERQCILRREIMPSGRTRAFINDSPTQLTTLRELSMRLVNIHSQHENRLLTEREFQLDVVDALAGNEELREEYAARFETLKQAVKKLKKIKADLQRSAENAEFMRYQLKIFEKVDPQPGETSELEQTYEQLHESVAAKLNFVEALSLINNSNTGVAEQLERVAELINENAALLPKDCKIVAKLTAAISEINEAANGIENAIGQIDAEPADLDYTETRLASLRDLQRRLGVETEEQLIGLRDSLVDKLDRLADAPNIIKEAQAEAREAMSECKGVASRLTESRKKAAAALGEALAEKARPLGMKNLQCEIEITESELTATGGDALRFLFAFNKNQALMPVGETASGGEISRLMLCLKSIIADKMSLPTIVFDEIDTGVSGDTAARMGALMHDIAKLTQTIVITHLPQVAAMGDYHYKVFKEDDETSTHTYICQLEGDDRINEIATMLGDNSLSEASLLNARALLDRSAAKHN